MTEVRWLCDTGMLGQLLEFITGYVGYVFGLGLRLTPMQWRLVWRSWNHNPCMSFSPLAYLKTRIRITNFSCLSLAVVRSSSDDNGIRHALPVLCVCT